jgi:hypothetical protein
VTEIYTNLFERAPEAAGFEYWVNGDGSTVEADQLIEAFLNAASTDDQAVVDNKLEVANHYTAELGGADTFDKAEAATFIDAVDGTDASVTDAKADIDAAVPVDGETFTLTTGTDKLVAADYELADGETEADVVRTTAGDDTIEGVSSALSSERTLDSADSIDGGAGEDTATFSLDSSFSGFGTTGGMANVETVELNNTSTIARSFDASGVTDVTNYVIDGSNAAVNLVDLLEAVNIDLSGQAEGTFSASFKDVADTTSDVVGGSSDALTLSLDGVGVVDDKSTTADERKEVTATVNDIEELTLDLTGDNVVQLGSNDAETITVTGAGTLDMDTISTATTSLDASAATGNLKIDTSAAAAGALTSLSTGAGDDQLTIDTDDMLANAAIAGGAGDDTLAVTSSTGATTQFDLSGFETLSLGALAASQTFSAKNFADVTTVKAASTFTGGASFINMGTQDLAVEVEGASAAGVTLASDHSGATTVDFNAAAKTVSKGTENTAADANNNAVKVDSSAGDLTVSVGEYMDASGAVDAAKATSVTLDIASGLDADDNELTEYSGTLTAETATSAVVNAEGTFNGTLDVAKAESVVLNATGSVNGSTIDADAASSVEITTGDNDDSLTLNADAAEAINVSAGADLTVVNTTSALQQVTVATAGAYIMNNAALADVAIVDLSGSNKDSAVTLGNLGDGTNDYNMTVTAAGLKAGLTVGTVDVEAARNITLTASEVTGDVTVGAIGATKQGAEVTVSTVGTGGDVDLDTVDATSNVQITNSSTGAFDVGVIGGNSATADVTLDLDGTTGAVTLAAISGEDVVINASDTIGGVTYGGTITATKSATVVGSEVKANGTAGSPVAVALDASSNDVTASITGGIEDDVFGIGVTDATNDLTSFNVDGGDSGTDVLSLGGGGADLVTEDATIAGVDQLIVDDTNLVTINASAISGQTMTIEGAAANALLTLTGTDSADTIDLTNITDAGNSALDLAIEAGKGDDTIKLSAATESIETVQFSASNGKDTITNFATTEDALSFDGVVTGLTTTTGTAAATGTVVAGALTDDSVYVVDNGASSLLSSGTETITDYTDLSDVADYLAEGYTSTAAADAAVFVINDTVGGKAYAYSFVEDGTALTISSGELEMVGVITEAAGGPLVVGDIA